MKQPLSSDPGAVLLRVLPTPRSEPLEPRSSPCLGPALFSHVEFAWLNQEACEQNPIVKQFESNFAAAV